MAKKKITEIVEEMLEDFLRQEGYELYNAEFVKEGRDWFLRVYIVPNVPIVHHRQFDSLCIACRGGFHIRPWHFAAAQDSYGRAMLSPTVGQYIIISRYGIL